MTLAELKKYIVSMPEELDDKNVMVSIRSDGIGFISVGRPIGGFFGLTYTFASLDSILHCSRSYDMPKTVDHFKEAMDEMGEKISYPSTIKVHVNGKNRMNVKSNDEFSEFHKMCLKDGCNDYISYHMYLLSYEEKRGKGWYRNEEIWYGVGESTHEEIQERWEKDNFVNIKDNNIKFISVRFLW
jgi:hypothetical protein